MNYMADNAKKITAAFERFRSTSELTMMEGLIGVLDAGVVYCLEEHDSKHRRHADRGDGYGWVLIHNGSEVKRKLFGDDAMLQSNASRALDYVSTKSPESGWVGIILATLRPVTYFNVMYEFVPMRAAIRDLKSDDFSRYFKPYRV